MYHPWHLNKTCQPHSSCAANPTRAMKEEWNRETKAAYDLSAEQLAEVDAQLEEIAASRALTAGPSSARVPLADLMGMSVASLFMASVRCNARPEDQLCEQHLQPKFG